jgi:hypothetical protein
VRVRLEPRFVELVLHEGGVQLLLCFLGYDLVEHIKVSDRLMHVGCLQILKFLLEIKPSEWSIRFIFILIQLVFNLLHDQ